MAVRHRLVKASPATVWEVLADGRRYSDWVVGTDSSEPREGQWPQEAASIGYQVKLGPLKVGNQTVVRHCVEGSELELELEAHAGPLGTARIAMERRPWDGPRPPCPASSWPPPAPTPAAACTAPPARTRRGPRRAGTGSRSSTAPSASSPVATGPAAGADRPPGSRAHPTTR
ncbi:SRPBCC family protein [Streptomyces collinus]|uniref:SRPBCC family protein n=1 Tax=Streptomyces collinus TaxID=42684 RepID=UPI002942424A|nr:SRPBCC family protein [Streptomyces collinus]